MQASLPTSLSSLFVAFDARYQAAFQAQETWAEKIATIIPSSNRSSTYFWADSNMSLREWVGERVVRNLALRGHTIENKDWELTLEINRNDIEDGNLGLKGIQASTMGAAARKWMDRVLATALLAGETTLCWDGQYFFDTDHPVNYDNAGLSTYGNLDTSKPLTVDNFEAQMIAFESYLDTNGQPMGLTATHLIVPPALRITAKKILTLDTLPIVYGSNTAATITGNVNKGSVELLVLPELVGEPLNWYLADLSKPIKPLVMQVRTPPRFQNMDGPQDSEMFWHRRAIFGCDARGAAGYSLPFLIRKLKG